MQDLLLSVLEHRIVYAIRAKTGREFRFAQTGLDEAALRRLVEHDLLG